MTFRWRLPCSLFGHRASREPVWNDGFYFAACARCGKPIVRIPGEAWHTPRRARVVWSATPPSSPAAVDLQRGKRRPLQALAELPANTRITGVAAREIRQGAQAPAAVAAQRRSSIPDFMDDPGPIEASLGGGPADRSTGPRPLPARTVRVA